MFYRIDGVHARCKYCLQEVRYCGSTSNLSKHLKKHPNLLDVPYLETTSVDTKSALFIQTKLKNTQNQLPQPCSSTTLASTSSKLTFFVEDSDPEECVDNSSDSSQALRPTDDSSQILCPIDDSSQALHPIDDPPRSLKRPIVEAFQKISSSTEGGYRYRKITMALLYFICKDYRPFAVIEGKGFKRFIKELAPSYKIPSVTTIKKILENKYEITKAALKSNLSASAHVSLTFDTWTETMAGKSFLGVTVHFLQDICLKSYTLAVSELKEQHTAQYIGEQLENILSDWEINKEKIVNVVTDNGANIVSAVHKTFGKHRHIPCFAHTINLVAIYTVGQKNIKPIISKVRNIVKFVKNSVKISDLLRKKQSEAQVPEGLMKNLILDVPTRWNSVYYMVNRFVEMVTLINPILLEDCTAPVMLTAIEMDTLRQLLDLLKPLEFVITESSGENYITISKVIPMISCLFKQLSQFKPRIAVISEIKDLLHAELVRRFGMIEQVKQIAIATLLDPRFKHLHFNDPIACASATADLRKISKLDVSSSESEGKPSNPDDFDFWAPHKMLAHGQKKKKSTNLMNDELSLYLSNPVSPLKSDPLEFWEDMKNIFPSLYKQARLHFTLVATSVPCERLFSKVGVNISKSRNRLTSPRLQKLLLLADTPEEDWF